MSLLRPAPLASARLHRPVFVYHEHDYWASLGPAYWERVWKTAPHVMPEYGGSKIRMLEETDLGTGPVATACTPHSSQARQMAAFMAARGMTAPLRVVIKPDSGFVDGQVLSAGNMRMATALYPNTEFRLVPDAWDHDAHDEAIAWSMRDDAVAVPRGIRSPRAVHAAARIGHDLGTAIEDGTLPERVTVLVVVGTGTLYLGIERGLHAQPLAHVTGLTARPIVPATVRRMRRTYDGARTITLVDGYATTSGVSHESARHSAESWREALGVRVEHACCGRLCQWLDARVEERTETALVSGGDATEWQMLDTTDSALVIIVSGVEPA